MSGPYQMSCVFSGGRTHDMSATKSTRSPARNPATSANRRNRPLELEVEELLMTEFAQGNNGKEEDPDRDPTHPEWFTRKPRGGSAAVRKLQGFQEHHEKKRQPKVGIAQSLAQGGPRSRRDIGIAGVEGYAEIWSAKEDPSEVHQKECDDHGRDPTWDGNCPFSPPSLLLQLWFRQSLDHHEEPTEPTPDHESPGRTMPQPRQQEGCGQTQHQACGAAPTPTDGDIHVVAEPTG